MEIRENQDPAVACILCHSVGRGHNPGSAFLVTAFAFRTASINAGGLTTRPAEVFEAVFSHKSGMARGLRSGSTWYARAARPARYGTVQLMPPSRQKM